ncbi:hypothetical protein MAP00_003287 [Monascus purpureus]|nr:hypothetical protein MAP00_003287 [Monascus purpureus]
MAAGTRTARSSALTRIVSTLSAGLWLLLLTSVADMDNQTWYLLGIGLLGSVQNLVASAVSQSPSALGFHLELAETIRGNSVSEVLKTTEIKYPSVGASLMPIFFPNVSSSMRVAPPDVPFW